MEWERSGSIELPSRHRRGMGNCRSRPPPPIPNSQAPHTAAGSRDLRSPAGASTAAGARGKPSGRRPRPPAAPRAARARPTQRAAPARAPPAPGTRGMRANGALALARGLALPSRPLGAWRPKAHKGASWRQHKPSVGLLNQAPAPTFRDARPAAFALPLSPALHFLVSTMCWAAPPHPDSSPSPSQAPEELQLLEGNDPGPRNARGLLSENGDRRAPATQPPQCPGLFRAIPLTKTTPEGCRGAASPFFNKSASASYPLRPSAGGLATHSPCCKRYRSPRSDHTTTQLARPTRTNSPPPPPAPHKHLPPPDPSAACQITEHRKRVPANPFLSNSSRDSFIHCYLLDEARDKGKRPNE